MKTRETTLRRSVMEADAFTPARARGEVIRREDAFAFKTLAAERTGGKQTRMERVTIPADRDKGTIAGGHCWAEFLAEGKWVPLDISEAAKQAALADYLFGHHPANRFELSVRRDLVVDPAPASGPINFHIDPLLELGGKVAATETELAFQRARK